MVLCTLETQCWNYCSSLCLDFDYLSEKIRQKGKDRKQRGRWTESRSTQRKTGRGLSTAAADDFCDCPKRVYLGTGWVEEGWLHEGRFQRFKLCPPGKSTKKLSCEKMYHVKQNSSWNLFLKSGIKKMVKKKNSCLYMKNVLNSQAESMMDALRAPTVNGGTKINSFQRTAPSMLQRCHRTWPGLGIETFPTSRLSADRPPFPFCIFSTKPCEALVLMIHVSLFPLFCPPVLMHSPGKL